jgi:hypothetical protein
LGFGQKVGFTPKNEVFISTPPHGKTLKTPVFDLFLVDFRGFLG